MAFVTIICYLSEYCRHFASLTLRTQLFATFNSQKLSLTIIIVVFLNKFSTYPSSHGVFKL
jgi:hypothetical protein